MVSTSNQREIDRASIANPKPEKLENDKLWIQWSTTKLTNFIYEKRSKVTNVIYSQGLVNVCWTLYIYILYIYIISPIVGWCETLRHQSEPLIQTSEFPLSLSHFDLSHGAPGLCATAQARYVVSGKDEPLEADRCGRRGSLCFVTFGQKYGRNDHKFWWFFGGFREFPKNFLVMLGGFQSHGENFTPCIVQN